MALSTQQKKSLKSHAHALKPVVMIGQSGLSSSVLDELELALNHHELIKVKISAADREEKNSIINEIAQKTHAEVIQTIGFIAVYYKENIDKKRYS